MRPAETQKENQMNKIKSVTPVQCRRVKGGGIKVVTDGGQGGWDVRIRWANGDECLVTGRFPYTLAQAQEVVNNNDYSNSTPADFTPEASEARLQDYIHG
jgi:hypothetical protein